MIRNVTIILILALLSFALYFLYLEPCYVYPLPNTAKSVDLSRYAGTWYEIALMPNRFERYCNCTKAIYKNMGSHLRVTNSCYKTLKRRYMEVVGEAWPLDASNSKLKIEFFWPFRGDYWILYIDGNYQYALVGDPSRDYLWILAREKTMPADEYEKLMFIAKQEGYDVRKMVRTPHNCSS